MRKLLLSLTAVLALIVFISCNKSSLPTNGGEELLSNTTSAADVNTPEDAQSTSTLETSQTEVTTSENTLATEEMTTTLPAFEHIDGFEAIELASPVNITPAACRVFYDAEGTLDVNSYLKTANLPKSVSLSWKSDAPAGTVYTVYFAENPDFAYALAYQSTEKQIGVTNLKLRTDYFWCVEYSENGTTYRTPISQFTTDEGVRWIQLSGKRMENIRDIGSWKTDSGLFVKQGMVIRGVEISGEHHEADEIGIYILSQQLGIKTDIDLRGGGETEGVTTSPIGEHVKYLHLPYATYTADILKAFAVKENYPIYLHCVWGADRTGAVCSLLLAILGVDEESIMREYELTSFSGSGKRIRTQDDFKKFWDSFMAQEGDTIRAKAENLAINTHKLTYQHISNINAILVLGGPCFDKSSLEMINVKQGETGKFTLLDANNVTSVTVNGKDADFSFENGILSFTVPTDASRGMRTGTIVCDGYELRFSIKVK